MIKLLISMLDKMSNNVIYRRSLIILLIVLFLISGNINILAHVQNNDCNDFYGFLIPNVDYEDDEFENLVYRNSMNLVNDLIRENITVYWNIEDISVNVFNLFDNDAGVKDFREGCFIVPFSGDIESRIKSINIVSNYNYTCEIKSIIDIQIPVYLICEEVDFSCYRLNKVKIIEYKNYLTCAEDWYQQVAFLCGFFDFDVYDNSLFSDKIDNSIYNLVIWPAYDSGYYPSYYAYFEFILDLYSKRTNEIRAFIRNGGGYVGSCYSVYMASAGAPPIYQKRKVLNPKLNNYGFLALQDMKVGTGEFVDYLEQVVVDKTHPVTTSLDDYILGGYGSGPKVTYAGNSVDVLITFQNSNSLNNTPSVVASDFGKGKVVSIGPHPEVSDYDTGPRNWDSYIKTHHLGKRLVINSFLFATSENDLVTMPHSYKYNDVLNVFNMNKNLSGLLDNGGDFFKTQINDLSSLLDKAYELDDLLFKTLEKINDTAKSENIDIYETRSYLSFGTIEYTVYESELLISHIKNIIDNLQFLENVVFLYSENNDFMNDVSNFKDMLAEKINSLENIISKSESHILKYNSIIDRYAVSKYLKTFYQKMAKTKGYDTENSFTSGNIFLISDISSEVVKFLRSSWIRYELLNTI